MKPLKEALISKSNRDWAATNVVFDEYKKSDLKTGDLVIIKWPQLLVFVKKEDANWNNFRIGRQFLIPNKYGDNFCCYETEDYDGTPLFSFLHLDGYSADLKNWDDDEEFDIIKVIPGVIKKKDVKDPKKLAKLLDRYTSEFLIAIG